MFGPKFCAKAADVDVNGAGSDEVLFAPHVAKELFAGPRDTGMCEKEFEQLKFGRGKFEFALTLPHTARPAVKPERTERD